VPGGGRLTPVPAGFRIREFQFQVPCLSPPFAPALAWRDAAALHKPLTVTIVRPGADGLAGDHGLADGRNSTALGDRSNAVQFPGDLAIWSAVASPPLADATPLWLERVAKAERLSQSGVDAPHMRVSAAALHKPLTVTSTGGRK